MAIFGALMSMVQNRPTAGANSNMLQEGQNSLGGLVSNPSDTDPSKLMDPSAMSFASSQGVAGQPGKAAMPQDGGVPSMGQTAPAAGNYGFGDFMRDMFSQTAPGKAYNALTDNSLIQRKATLATPEDIAANPPPGGSPKPVNPPAAMTQANAQPPGNSPWGNIASMFYS